MSDKCDKIFGRRKLRPTKNFVKSKNFKNKAKCAFFSLGKQKNKLLLKSIRAILYFNTVFS